MSIHIRTYVVGLFIVAPPTPSRCAVAGMPGISFSNWKEAEINLPSQTKKEKGGGGGFFFPLLFGNVAQFRRSFRCDASIKNRAYLGSLNRSREE